jgi:outer membrane protein TolC
MPLSCAFLCRIPIIVSAAVVCAFAGGCARETYRPAPLDPEATAVQFEARSLMADGLRDYLRAQGQPVDPWPPARWDLARLTLAAVYHHPEIALARTRAELAGAEKHTSTTGQPISITPRPELNTAESGDDSPWGFGVLVGLPVDLGGKRAARTEQLARLEDAARVEIAVASWRVRSRLRRHFVDLYVAGRTLEAVGVEQAARRKLLELMTKREAAGFASASETGALRVKVAEGEVAVRRAAIRRDQALAGVAEAVGVPLDALKHAAFDFASVAAPAAVPPPAEIRRAALVNRIDLRRKLADYAAAEAAVKLEVARQYPDLTVLPGYFWDADETIWSVALSAIVPPRARTRALIREAELRREVEARAFLAVQASVLAEAQAAASRYELALAAHRAAEEQITRAEQHRAQIARQFERGQADRVELTQAQLESAMTERAAVVAMLEVQQGLSALEDALQRPIDNPDLMSTAQAVTAPADTGLNPALVDND